MIIYRKEVLVCCGEQYQWRPVIGTDVPCIVNVLPRQSLPHIEQSSISAIISEQWKVLRHVGGGGQAGITVCCFPNQNLNVLVVNSGLRSLGSITPKRAESDSETLHTMSRMTRKTLVPGDRYWRFWTRPRHGLDWGIDGWQQQYFEEMQHQTAAGEKLFLIILISPPVLSSHYCALSCVSKLHKYNSANNQPTPLLPDWPALLIAVLSFPQLAISWSTFTGIEAMTTTT